MTSINTVYKGLKTSRSNRYEEIKIDTIDGQSSVQENDEKNHPQFYKDTDEMRSARQNELKEVKRKKFEFSFWSHIL